MFLTCGRIGLPGDIIEVVENHHERYDGRGYPYGLKGSEISLGARIIAVDDALYTTL